MDNTAKFSHQKTLYEKITNQSFFDKLKNNRRLKQNIPLLCMFSFVIAFYVIFKYLPMLGLVIAFKNFNFNDGIFGSPWTGLSNFKLLFSMPNTLNIIKNTFLLSVYRIIFGFPAPVILAVLINEIKNKHFKKSIQTLVYLPHFFSWVIVAGIVTAVFSQENGIVNNYLKALTGSGYAFLYNIKSWTMIFIGSGIWKEAGFGTVIYLAALAGIDPSLYEAAAIDGANKFKQIWHVTLPGIRSTIIIVFILSVGKVMEVGFDQVYMLQNEIILNESDVISTYIYRVGIQGAQFSLTSAMGLFESFIGFILVVTCNKISSKFGEGLW